MSLPARRAIAIAVYHLVAVTGGRWTMSPHLWQRVHAEVFGPDAEAEASVTKFCMWHADTPNCGLALGRNTVAQVPRGDQVPAAADS